MLHLHQQYIYTQWYWDSRNWCSKRKVYLDREVDNDTSEICISIVTCVTVTNCAGIIVTCVTITNCACIIPCHYHILCPYHSRLCHCQNYQLYHHLWWHCFLDCRCHVTVSPTASQLSVRSQPSQIICYHSCRCVECFNFIVYQQTILPNTIAS